MKCSVGLLKPWPMDFKGESGALGQDQPCPVPRRDGAHQCKAKAMAGGAPVALGPGEAVEGFGPEVGGQAGAGVGNTHQGTVGFGGEVKRQAVAGGAVFDCVVEEV